MKTLLKLAVGIAAAGILVEMLMKRRSGQGAMESSHNDMAAAGGHEAVRSSADEMVGDTNSVSGGDPAEEQRGPQPQDWRGAQNVLDS
jgi:hypothetical protein